VDKAAARLIGALAVVALPNYEPMDCGELEEQLKEPT